MVRSTNQSTALKPALLRPDQTTDPATAARTVLRARVAQPAGPDESCPKQWQSGVRPRARLRAMAKIKSSNNERAPSAPNQAEATGNSVTATTNSAKGSTNASGTA